MLSGTTTEIFVHLGGTTAALSNLNVEHAAVVSAASYKGIVVTYIDAGATATLNNVYVTGFTSALGVAGGVAGVSSTTTTLQISNVGASVVVAGAHKIGGVIGKATGTTTISSSNVAGYFLGIDDIGGIGGDCVCAADNVAVTSVILASTGNSGGIFGIGSTAAPISVTNNSSANANIYSASGSGGIFGTNILAPIAVSHVAANGFVYAWTENAVGMVNAVGPASIDHASFTGDLVAPNGKACGAISSASTSATATSVAVNGNLVGQGSSAGLVCEPLGSVAIGSSIVSCNITLVPGGTGAATGGLVGMTYHATSVAIDSSAFLGTINGTASSISNTTGGLVGDSHVNLSLTNNFVKAQFSSDNGLGGLVGAGDANGNTETVKNNFVIAVSSSPLAGLINKDATAAGTVDHNVAIIGGPAGTPGVRGTSSSSASYGNNYYSWIPGYVTFANTGGGSTGATAVGNANTFMSSGNAPMSTWDFSTVWKLPSGGGFPVLQWQQ